MKVEEIPKTLGMFTKRLELGMFKLFAIFWDSTRILLIWQHNF